MTSEADEATVGTVGTEVNSHSAVGSAAPSLSHGGRVTDLPSADHDDVDSSVVCVLTRFALRRPWHLLQTYLAYRWLIRRMESKRQAGLLKSAFLVEGLTTCYSLSIWADDSTIPRFGTAVEEHVTVAREVFGRLKIRNRRAEIWSSKWRLAETSNNLNWNGFDLHDALGGAARRQG